MNAQTPLTSKLEKYHTPIYLKAGDTVVIVAPSGILKGRQHAIDKAQQLLKNWGLFTVLGRHVFAQNHHFAGSDAQRKSDMQWALDHPNAKAIWCARGGYGSIRILDDLNFNLFKKQPKWLIGYSDITALHNTINNLGFESIHGMMAVNLEEDRKATSSSIETLKLSLFGQLKSYKIAAQQSNKKGTAEGILVGGNLTLLANQLGSASQIDTKGKILFIEEIGEYKYHIDRMLQSLKRAGYFEQCTGVIVGDMTKIKSNTTAWGSSVEKLILNILEPYDIPIAFGIPAGHELDNRALIFGRYITLKVTSKETQITF
jgi:muramoyltetrapeptide carboxypeptidase